MINLDFIHDTHHAKATPLIGRGFFNIVIQLIAASQKSICVTVFQGSRQALKNQTKTGRLVSALVKAKERGVDVRVLIHSPATSFRILRTNEDFLTALRQGGLNYRLGRPDDTLHAKLMIIDDLVTICGSHNMTDRGLWDNYEAAVAVESAEIAQTFMKYFEFLWKRSRKEDIEWQGSGE